MKLRAEQTHIKSCPVHYIGFYRVVHSFDHSLSHSLHYNYAKFIITYLLRERLTLSMTVGGIQWLSNS